MKKNGFCWKDSGEREKSKEVITKMWGMHAVRAMKSPS